MHAQYLGIVLISEDFKIWRSENFQDYAFFFFYQQTILVADKYAAN